MMLRISMIYVSYIMYDPTAVNQMIYVWYTSICASL